MKKILLTLLLCITLAPLHADETAGQSTASKITGYFKTAAQQAAAASQTETPKEEQGIVGKTIDAISTIKEKGQAILPDMTGLQESWNGLKENCTEIKDTTVKTLNLLMFLTVGVAIFTSLVPILLFVIVIYLRKIDRKLGNAHE